MMKPQPGEQFSPSVASQALHNLRSVPTSAPEGKLQEYDFAIAEAMA